MKKKYTSPPGIMSPIPQYDAETDNYKNITALEEFIYDLQVICDLYSISGYAEKQIIDNAKYYFNMK